MDDEGSVGSHDRDDIDNASQTTASTMESSFVSPLGHHNPIVLKKKSPAKKKAMNNVTTLTFIRQDGSRYEDKLQMKVASYSELQREIARLNPHSRDMYIIQDERGSRISSDNYIPRKQIVVRSTFLKPPTYADVRKLPFNWEATDYHEVRLKMEAEKQAEFESSQVVSLI
ncbi:hypothetical protein EON65_31600 [archaeon]|nr:MAG: hypothetical protein EON65_31600 [archaeon]